MILNKLKYRGFDFESKIPEELFMVYEFLFEMTNGTLETDNQKLNVLDYNLWLAINELQKSNPIVSKVRKEVKIDDSLIDNEGFDTPTEEDYEQLTMFDQGGQLTLFDEPEVAEEEIIINPEFLKARRESEPDPQFTVLSFGGGQDSFAILYSLVYDYDFKKKYAPNDFIVVMSDTGNEFPYTYQAVKEAEKFCNEHDIHFKFVTPDMGYHTDGWQSLKANMKRNKVIFGAAMARKSCTSSLKIDVVDKYAYDYMCNLYGFEEAKSKKSWYAYKYKFNTKARVLIGFAKDEESRAKKSIKGHKFLPKWKKTNIQYVYPLIEEGWNRQSAQNIIKLYRELIPPSNCMICFYQSDQELIWLEKNHPEEFNEWVIMEKAKLDRFEGKVDKNYGVYGAITLPEKLAKAKAKYGHMTDEELWEYKMSHGHCVKSAY